MMDGLVSTLMSAVPINTTVAFMHPVITLSALTIVRVTKDSWGMDNPVMILMNAIPINTSVVIMHFAITLSALTSAFVDRDS